MAVQKIDIEQFLELSDSHVVLDVRSPGEYDHAHIPGAISFPLFSDEERKIVGTTYKQKSREQAIKIGLEFFGPKMRKMVEEVEEIISNRQNILSNEEKKLSVAKSILVHCWRGGMRSGAVSWLLDMYGFKVYTLVGGYKKYRNHVLDTFKIPFDLKILGGYTGSGKTGLLKALQQKGEIIIDLEGIANHKGSAFGNIGLPKQPGQEMFENHLAKKLRGIITEQNRKKSTDPSKPTRSIWTEDESQRIGLVNIPGDLWTRMRQSPVFFLDIPFEERLKQIVEEYGVLNVENLADAINRISQKLGNLNAKTAILHLKEGKISECFDILLKYYDKHYFKSLHNREGINSLLKKIECKSVTTENAEKLIRLSELQQQGL